MFYLLYVDDDHSVCTSYELDREIKAKLNERFKRTDNGEVTYTLGTRVTYGPDR